MKPITNKQLSVLASLVVCIALIIVAHSVSATIPRGDPKEEDVYQSFLEGERIANGIDPYARILGGDMRINEKYPTYFPLFYELSYLSQKLGLTGFSGWIAFWQTVAMIFNSLIALLLYAALAANQREWVGAAAAAFWLFNRWTLYIITSSNFDFLPIFFMLAALVLYPTRKWPALLLFSISLALKQIGIFIAPFFVVWAFAAEKNHWKGIQQAFITGLVIGSVPLITSLPFLFWNLEGFLRSIAFSATRLGQTHSNLSMDSLDVLLGWQGWSARIPMAVLLICTYGFAAKRPDRKFLAAFLALAVFICFNAVLFNQYLAWLLSIVPLLVIPPRAGEGQPRAGLLPS